jgi:hypothetical protein
MIIPSTINMHDTLLFPVPEGFGLELIFFMVTGN